ncbi:hypothetical protein IMY05_005G0102400 [Salix suchowensis]|nr:hypothetical protein IMY05_005G0102400 [Salix suchowensis]
MQKNFRPKVIWCRNTLYKHAGNSTYPLSALLRILKIPANIDDRIRRNQENQNTYSNMYIRNITNNSSDVYFKAAPTKHDRDYSPSCLH